MSASKKTTAFPQQSAVVGTIPSLAALRCALRLKPGAVDFYELRVDHFANDPAPLLRAAPELNAPLIITVRAANEGGAGPLANARRTELYAAFLPYARFLDLEIRSFARLQATLTAARVAGVPVIGSAHFFKRTPPLALLEKLRVNALATGAAHCKIATFTQSMGDVLTLVQLLLGRAKGSLSVMGMGPQGKLSRLLLARAGSVFNYGYLDAAQVPGQWPAPLLKQRLHELGDLS